MAVVVKAGDKSYLITEIEPTKTSYSDTHSYTRYPPPYTPPLAHVVVNQK